MKAFNNLTLRPGDAVTVISPASHLHPSSEKLVAEGLKVLRAWGLRPVRLIEPSDSHLYLAGPDTHRYKELSEALQNERIKAVFSARGGYGSARLLTKLESIKPRGTKIFCGFSDLTTLGLAFSVLFPKINNIHGPNIFTKQFVADTEAGVITRNSLKNTLFNESDNIEHQIDCIIPGKVSGPILGGCLSMITNLIGTPFAPSFNDKVIFIEDVGETPYKIDRMITHIACAGIFNNIKGVIFGEMKGCASPSLDLKDILSELLAPYGVPVGYGFESGHGDINKSFRLGHRVTLDTTAGVLTFH